MLNKILLFSERDARHFLNLFWESNVRAMYKYDKICGFQNYYG
jgi:hypothetical protein